MQRAGFPSRSRGSRLLSLLSAGWVAASAAGDAVRLASPALGLAVDGVDGRLIEFVDRASQHNFAGSAREQGGLWAIELERVGTLTPTNARSFSATPLGNGLTGLRLVWSGFGLARAPGLRVEVTVQLEPGASSSRWHLSLPGLGGNVPLRIRFPRLWNVPEQADEHLAVPEWMGKQAANPRTLLRGAEGPRRFEWAYPGLLSMQCVALSAASGPGLYLACDDATGQLKQFAAFGGGDTGLNFEIVHQPARPGPPGRDDRLPYSVIVGAFKGDWFDAAARYRAWATNQTWAAESCLRRGRVPAWVTNTALWVWNRGGSPGVIEPALVLQEALRTPVSVFWHWWHGCAYDAGFPEYLPPREGEAAFRKALARAHEHGVHALVYMNQRLWGMTTASWTNRNAARFAVKTSAGQITPEVYNTFTKTPCASMCLGTAFWRDTYASLATEAFRGLDVDGIYMDQACTSLACYDGTHGHPMGGGTYWMEGFKALAADIRQRCELRGGPALAGEGCGENWLPYLDLMLSLQVSRERYAAPDGWEPIPFFHAVYHGYAVFFGNYASLTRPPYDELWPAQFAPREPLKLLDRKFSRQFYLEQARGFVWGQQPTLANFRPDHLQSRAEELDYVRRLARIHRLARAYLLDGTMLPPPRVTAPVIEQAMSRLSIYAGQQGSVREFRKAVPQVWVAAWRSPDGKAAVAVASLSDQALTPVIELGVTACGLPARGTVRAIRDEGPRRAGTFQATGGVVVLRPKLAPRDAAVFELAHE